jgi:hypothetical protein
MVFILLCIPAQDTCDFILRSFDFIKYVYSVLFREMLSFPLCCSLNPQNLNKLLHQWRIQTLHFLADISHLTLHEIHLSFVAQNARNLCLCSPRYS